MSILSRQGLENCILREDPSADSNDFLKVVFANFGYWEYFSNFLTNYLQSVFQNRFLRVHRTNFGETNYWKVCFFSFWYWAEKFQPMVVKFWHLLSKVQGNLLTKKIVSQKCVPLHKFWPLSKNRSARVVVFWASSQFCNLRVQQNLSKNFFSNENTFFIFFGLWEKCFLIDSQTFSGRTVRTAFFESARTIRGKLFFFGEGFIFDLFRTLSKKMSLSASQISVSCPKWFQCVQRNF